MPYLEEHIALKKAIYDRYKQGFKDLPVVMNPFEEENALPNFWLSSIIIDADALCFQSRDGSSYTYKSAPGKTCPHEILDALNVINAEGRPIWKPMHAQPIFQECELVTCENESVGMDIFNRGLCLPSDIKMTPKEQNAIIEVVKGCFK